MNDKPTFPVKSYTTAAVVVFVLYCLFWLPGFVANWLYLHEARQAEKVYHQELPGVSCLTYMMLLLGWTVVILLFVGLVVFGLPRLIGNVR